MEFSDEAPQDCLKKPIGAKSSCPPIFKRLFVLLGISLIDSQTLSQMLKAIEEENIDKDDITNFTFGKLCQNLSKETGIYNSKEKRAYWLIPLFIVRYDLNLEKLLDDPSDRITQNIEKSLDDSPDETAQSIEKSLGDSSDGTAQNSDNSV